MRIYFLILLAVAFSLADHSVDAQTRKGKKAGPPAKVTPTQKPAQQKPEPQKSSLKSVRINSVLKESFPYKFGKPDPLGEKLELVEYDHNGNQTLFVKYDDGHPVERKVMRYDAGGNKVEEKAFDEDSTVTSWSTCKYDPSGHLLEVIRHSTRDSSVAGKLEYRYDASGNRLDELEYDSDGSIENKTVNSYDGNRNLIEATKYRSSERVDSKQKFTYDNKGNKLTAILYDADGDIDSKTSYRYDDNGNLLEQTTANANGDVKEKLVQKYDAGNKIEIARYKSEDRLESREKDRFDGRTKVESSFYDSDDTFLHSITFRYDAHGNLIEEIEHDKLTEPQNAVRYTITYY